MPTTKVPFLKTIVRRRKVPGLLLFDTHGSLQSSNSVARKILHDHRRNKERFFQKIRRTIQILHKARVSPTPPAHPPAGHLAQGIFFFGQVPYVLRAFPLHQQVMGRPPLVAVLLERINPSRLDLHKAQQLFSLSPREVEAITALQSGMTDKEIASTLGITTDTTRGYLKSIRAKMGVSTRTAILHKLLHP